MYLVSLLSASTLFFSASFLNAHDPANELAANRRAGQEFLTAVERQLGPGDALRSEVAAVGDVQEGRRKKPVPVSADSVNASAATTAALSFLAIAGFAFAGAGLRKRR